MEGNFNVKADKININAPQESYSHLAVLDTITYFRRNIEMRLKQDMYNATGPLEYFAADGKCSFFAVRLLIG